MANQISIPAYGKMVEVTQEAQRAFPEAKTPGKALTYALLNWHQNRQEGKAFTELERVEQQLAQQQVILQQILEELKTKHG